MEEPSSLADLGGGYTQVRERVLGLLTEAGADVQAVIAENQRVHSELDRLRRLLRQHGIEPDDGTARTA